MALTYIEIQAGKFCCGHVTFLNCRSTGPEKCSGNLCTLVLQSTVFTCVVEARFVET